MEQKNQEYQLNTIKNEENKMQKEKPSNPHKSVTFQKVMKVNQVLK